MSEKDPTAGDAAEPLVFGYRELQPDSDPQKTGTSFVPALPTHERRRGAALHEFLINVSLDRSG